MSAPETLESLSAAKFAELGLLDRAYVKRVVRRGTAHYAVHAADGTYMWRFPTRELAFATVHLHDVQPVSVH